MVRQADPTYNPDELPDGFDASFPLSDPRHEMFAQGISDGMTQLAAYDFAGFVAQSSNANLLAKRAPVKARIEWLKRKKAEQAGLTFAGEMVVDLDKVNENAAKGSPEWFLHQVFSIAEGTDEGTRVSDKLSALKLGADWMGYFKNARPGMKTKDAGDAEAISEDSPRRIVAGQPSTLSKYSSLIDGLGQKAPKPDEVRVDGSDHGGGDDATEADLAE